MSNNVGCSKDFYSDKYFIKDNFYTNTLKDFEDTETFEMVRAINSTYDCGNYILEVNRKIVFNGYVSNDYELIIKTI